MTALAGWENFYVIVGSSAGGLIGLQFVVITLIADMPIRGAKSKPARHLLRRRLNAPWQGVAGPAVLWGLLGPQWARVRDHRGST